LEVFEGDLVFVRFNFVNVVNSFDYFSWRRVRGKGGGWRRRKEEG
jgi:hypothetical protein